MKYLLIASAFAVCVAGEAFAYPTNRQSDLTEGEYLYATGSVYPDLGDLQFYGPDEKPSFASLSALERLMVDGSPRDNSNDPLEPYFQVVAMGAALYYKAFGRVPEQLDPATFRSVPGYEKASDTYVEGFRNPITNDWPRLNSSAFSPGDFYIRPLTNQELQQLSVNDEEARRLWFDHKITSYTDRGERDASLDQPVQISVVLYGRMYGDSTPLLSFINTYTGGS